MAEFSAYLPWVYACTALFGLIIGSFLTVVITRYPEILQQQWRAECCEFLQVPNQTPASKLSIALPRSRCPHCKVTLKMRHNIPLLGYLLLGGKCSNCSSKISALYPIVEILTAALSVLLLWHFGLSWALLAALVFCYALITLCAIDFFHQILPDAITLTVLWLGLLLNSGWMFVSLNNAVWSAALSYLFLWFTGWLFLKIRQKQGMGHGDFKMLAMIGAWLGGLATLNTLILSVLLGSVISLLMLALKKADWRRPVPFGPFLGLAAIITLLAVHFKVRWFWTPVL